MESGWTHDLLNWLNAHPGWGFVIVLLVAFFESLVLIGILLPGMFILFGVGALVGLGVIELVPIWIAATVGAFLGDTLSYLLGHRFRGHLLLAGERIEAVLRERDGLPAADEVLDVGGACIAPGFVDMHSHCDWVLPDPDHPELMHVLLEQGITTVVAGNCGISPAPVQPRAVRHLEALAAIAIDRPLAYDWRTMAGYLERLEQARPVVNVAELVGHASLRYAEAETRRGAMSHQELRRCP